MKRPDACMGCPADPDSARYDPSRTGAFVPPSACGSPVPSPDDFTPERLRSVDLVIVAMNPSGAEVEEGEPLVGPSWFEFYRGLAAVKQRVEGLNLLKTNVFNCRSHKPGKTVDFVNRDPTATEVKACTRRWLVPLLRSLDEAETLKGAPIHLLVMGTLAHNAVFQNHYGTFSGSKASRGARLNRNREPYSVLADRLERWATGSKKTRFCIRESCGQPILEPRVRICAACRLAEGKSDKPKKPRKPRARKQKPQPQPFNDDDIPF